MSSYPPPPPDPYAGGYSRGALRAQRRMLEAQARAERQRQRAMRRHLLDQQRAARRISRRGSIVGPLLILAVGVTLLLAELGRIEWEAALRWYGRWWPAVMIAAGVILLLEWLADERLSASRRSAASAAGAGPAGGEMAGWAQGSPGRVLGGGVVLLLVLLALAGLGVRLVWEPVQGALGWRNHSLADGSSELAALFGQRYDTDSSMANALPEGSTLLIHDPHGDVTVSGASSDGQVHVSVHSEAHAWDQELVRQKMQALQPRFSLKSGVLRLDGSTVEGGETDLTVTLPHTAGVTIVADQGDVTVSETGGPVTISANHGDVDVSGVNNSVTLHLNDDDASLTLHSIHGPVVAEGHCGDIDISEVKGDLTLRGDFFGTTDLEHVDGAIRFETSRTQFSAARLEDEFDVDNDSLDANELLGPVVLKTEDKNITLDRVEGSVTVTNRDGSVEVTQAAPLGALSIQNHAGSVDVGLPGDSGFDLDAQTRNGEMENDFGLSAVTADDVSKLRGRVGKGGPTVTIATSDGDVTVRRSSVAPLPPEQAPATITFPQRGRGSKAPRAQDAAPSPLKDF